MILEEIKARFAFNLGGPPNDCFEAQCYRQDVPDLIFEIEWMVQEIERLRTFVYRAVSPKENPFVAILKIKELEDQNKKLMIVVEAAKTMVCDPIFFFTIAAANDFDLLKKALDALERE